MANNGTDFPAPLTEPVIVHSTLIEGLDATLFGNNVRIVGWDHIPAIGGEQEERRVVARLVMDVSTAKILAGQLQRLIKSLSK